jgi:hypothetical protein
VPQQESGESTINSRRDTPVVHAYARYCGYASHASRATQGCGPVGWIKQEALDGWYAFKKIC